MCVFWGCAHAYSKSYDAQMLYIHDSYVPVHFFTINYNLNFLYLKFVLHSV